MGGVQCNNVKSIFGRQEDGPRTRGETLLGIWYAIPEIFGCGFKDIHNILMIFIASNLREIAEISYIFFLKVTCPLV